MTRLRRAALLLSCLVVTWPLLVVSPRGQTPPEVGIPRFPVARLLAVWEAITGLRMKDGSAVDPFGKPIPPPPEPSNNNAEPTDLEVSGK